MEPDELKAAWLALDRRLTQHNQIHLTLLRESRIEKARGNLRPLVWGQLLQMLLGIALVVLGVACWTHNIGVTGLFAAGLVVHVFGVVTIAAAGITLGLVGSIDYSAPVLAIQKQMARLLRFYTLNASVCGLPWWIMWVFVVVALAGLGPTNPQAPTPTWVWASLATGAAGLLATGLFWLWRRRVPAARREGACVADGADGIRRSQRILDEVARFEQE